MKEMEYEEEKGRMKEMGKDKGGGEEEKLNSVDQDIIIGTTTNKLSLD